MLTVAQAVKRFGLTTGSALALERSVIASGPAHGAGGEMAAGQT